MNNRPKVSVITGYYNRAQYLDRTIESIRTQTFSDWELLIFDDCSTDDTRERLEKLLDGYQDPRISVLWHQENLGFVEGMRRAVSAARGEYIAVQGSGDVSLPRRLEIQAGILDAHPMTGVVAGSYFYLQENGQSRRLKVQDPKDLSFSGMLEGVGFTHGEVMYRKSIYERVGGYRPEFVFAQDYDLWLRMIKVTAFATVEEPIYERYGLSDGASYKAEKFVEQRLLSEAARRLALLDESGSREALERLRINGATALVPLSDPEIQRRLCRGAIRMITLGAEDSGRDVAKKYVDNKVWRAGLRAFAAAYPENWFAPFRRILQRKLGIASAEQRGQS